MQCTLCPRRCLADRTRRRGYCGASESVRVARAALHFWEEPCISGTNGSGAVFFCGCQLHCVYCQNRAISYGDVGKEITVEHLSEVFFRLQAQGAHNINLVTPDPYLPQVALAIRLAKRRGLSLPFLMNCSGYETEESLRSMQGLIDIYLPDFKYRSPLLAKKYSHAPDYPVVAEKAIAEMVRQQPSCRFDRHGLLQSGVLVRHLLLPGHVSDSKRVLAYLHQTYHEQIFISIMRQYTPFAMQAYPELNRPVTEQEYDELVSFACDLGIRQAYIQDGEAVSESFIPAFDGEGV